MLVLCQGYSVYPGGRVRVNVLTVSTCTGLKIGRQVYLQVLPGHLKGKPCCVAFPLFALRRGFGSASRDKNRPGKN